MGGYGKMNKPVITNSSPTSVSCQVKREVQHYDVNATRMVYVLKCAGVQNVKISWKILLEDGHENIQL